MLSDLVVVWWPPVSVLLPTTMQAENSSGFKDFNDLSMISFKETLLSKPCSIDVK